MAISMSLPAHHINIVVDCRCCKLKFIVLNALTLNVALLTMFLHPSKLGLGLSSVANFSNRAPTSVERTACLFARKTMQFGFAVCIRVMVIFRCFFFLINRHLKMSRSSFLTELFKW